MREHARTDTKINKKSIKKSIKKVDTDRYKSKCNNLVSIFGVARWIGRSGCRGSIDCMFGIKECIHFQSLFVFKVGCALRNKRRHAFLLVRCCKGTIEKPCFEFQRLLQCHFIRGIHSFFRHARNGLGVRCNCVGHGQRFLLYIHIYIYIYRDI